MINNRSVLLLTTPFRPNIGGVETHLDDLIKVGVSKGFKFIVLTYQPLVTKAKGQSIEKGKGFVVYRIGWIRFNLFLLLEKIPVLEFLYLAPGLLVGALILLFKKGNEISTIHAQGLVAGAVAVLVGKLFGKKIIISTHSIYNFNKAGLYTDFVKWMFNNCEQVLTLSVQSKKEILKLGISPSKVNVFTYWVNQKIFKPRKLAANINNFVVLFVGRLVQGKGLSEFLATARLQKNIRFLVVGDGPLASEIEKAKMSLDNLKYIGKVENEKLPFYYNQAQVLIVPSTHEEGYGRVILEAFSCGLPVIAANRGGIKEFVSKDTGILIEVSPKNISKTIVLLKKDPAKLKRMSTNALEFARNNFSEKNVEQILKYYE